MAIRFQTYFGIPIPPFKEKKIGAGSTTIRFVLVGTVPSKKNNMQSVAVRRDAREFVGKIFAQRKTMTKGEALKAIRMVYSKVRPNSKYAAFLQEQKPVLQQQMAIWSDRLRSKGLIFPLSKASLTLRFYFKSRYIQDTVNKQQSIQDLLIDAGILSDDDYKTVNPVHSASACYYQEIKDTITFVSLSFRL
jgi:hypothetical protein